MKGIMRVSPYYGTDYKYYAWSVRGWNENNEVSVEHAKVRMVFRGVNDGYLPRVDFYPGKKYQTVDRLEFTCQRGRVEYQKIKETWYMTHADNDVGEPLIKWEEEEVEKRFSSWFHQDEFDMKSVTFRSPTLLERLYTEAKAYVAKVDEKDKERAHCCPWVGACALFGDVQIYGEARRIVSAIRAGKNKIRWSFSDLATGSGLSVGGEVAWHAKHDRRNFPTLSALEKGRLECSYPGAIKFLLGRYVQEGEGEKRWSGWLYQPVPDAVYEELT